MANEDRGVEHIPLHPPGRGAYAFLLIVLIPFLGFLVHLYLKSSDGLSPAQANEQLRGLLLSAVVAMLSVLPILWALRRRVLFLTARELVFRGGFFSRKIPISSLRLAAAQQLSLFDRMELAPRWRTNGIRLPGYRVGWFRLRNGDKALMYMTDPFRITHLPTSEGFALMFSTDALIPALQRRMAAVNPPTAREPGASR